MILKALQTVPILKFAGLSFNLSPKTFIKLKVNSFFGSILLFLSVSLLAVNIFAQTPSVETKKNIKVVSYDWFTGKNWILAKEFFGNYCKNIRYADKQTEGFHFFLTAARNCFDNLPDGFIYQITVQNDSGKKIDALIWEYDFKNPLTKETLGTHTFTSWVQIEPSEKKNLFVFSNLPPTAVISVELLARNQERPYLESAVIKSIIYK